MKRVISNIQRFSQNKKLAFLLMLLGVGFLTVIVLFFLYLLNNVESRYIPEKKLKSSKKTKFASNEETLSSESETKTVKHILIKDNTLYDVLREDNITLEEIFSLLIASKKVYNLSRIRPGNTLELEMNMEDNTVNCLRYEIDEDSILILERLNNVFYARKEKIEYETRLSVKVGVIQNSLFETIVEVGLDPQMAINLADIFAWDIDFYVDIREGDEFKILFEQKYKDGDFVRNGRILCAEFINQGKVFSALFFKDKDGHGDYYDPKGNSLQKKFLKSPLRYSYISSRYSRSRFHPILKIYRPHLGIDYAAPKGTPVVAIGNGRIVFSGREGGYGKIVKIKHNGIYTSMYGHLSRFAKGIKRKKYVKQGMVIGYVGSTGLATGPHLDYRLVKNGRFINPLTYNPPSAGPVKKKYMGDFEMVKRDMVSKLIRLDPTTVDKHFAEGRNLR
ncbi:MAG: hypothetical protein COW04_02990 [Deltaproteobacteria bacterium CG12_big_fil_rev_8_21_14_0_65_43_10]|nr:MAG: hypothetical protein COW04_02990 [Deltaproteobacteria bacterium CG12_big_fil_rev_8_21_14_0_65_43_10]PIU85844.1 MAG: hypothetical protein COS67_05655 [Deltaproteobacteria bacterium CG06_land_8_20_14_3_00_44_19]PIX23750.1 MAG: hypothetical protein COZ68_08470 [Deltaproteobacteria bacterium CG_4_8_14_3_um_filter_43_13]PIZ20770.1 MAG: hypothetical protein COY50_03010 [Deltaproteobacteria bacterium CG_4_10_14_0_8_um_filter_43_12]PJB43352.1 MAG: hypothetical protein CO106_04715 [Deltaproteoba